MAVAMLGDPPVAGHLPSPGDRFRPFMVDTGLLRRDEAPELALAPGMLMLQGDAVPLRGVKTSSGAWSTSRNQLNQGGWLPVG